MASNPTLVTEASLNSERLSTSLGHTRGADEEILSLAGSILAKSHLKGGWAVFWSHKDSCFCSEYILYCIEQQEKSVNEEILSLAGSILAKSHLKVSWAVFWSHKDSSLVPRLSNYCGGGKESLVSIAYACA